MRIITGEYKGRKIDNVKGADIRYTADRVKESLFSILSGIISESRFLDLYAGSGNIGIEAFSRGAKSVVFVDINPICINSVSANLERFGIDTNSPEIKLMRMNASLAIEYFRRHEMVFDIIFIDPPYRIGLVEKTLLEISSTNILAEDGDIIVEHDIKEKASSIIGKLTLIRQEKYGTTLLSFYRRVMS
jgi:16S rRNA (guanine966-N2)-methyltransferase